MTQVMGPHESGQARPTEAPKVHAAHHLDSVPDALIDVALIDGPTCAAVGQVSISTWHELVRTGDAPAPAVRGNRCTRWRLVVVADYWRRRAEQGTPHAAERQMQQAHKASAAARAKRTERRANAAAVGLATKPLEAPSAKPSRWAAVLSQAGQRAGG